MNEVDTSREKVLDSFRQIGVEQGFDTNQFLAANEQITPEAAPVDLPPSSELLLPVAKMAAANIAPNWRLDEGELKQLCDAYGDLLDKYFPGGWLGWLDRYKEEVAVVTVTYMVIFPRIGEPLQIAPEPEAEPEQKKFTPVKEREPQNG